MNAVLVRPAGPPEVHLETLTLARLDEVLEIEAQAYDFPWTRGNFTDSLASGYAVQLLYAGEHLLGYYVAMRGVEEAHLLNLTVAPAFRRQGWARVLLEALALWSRAQGARWLWLEVRASNAPARALYESRGFRRVGERPHYYPAPGGGREDAVVMSLEL